MQQPPLELLLRWLHSGEAKDAAFKAAFSAYYAAMSSPLRRTLRHHLRNRPLVRESLNDLAEDLLQEVFTEWLKWIGTDRPKAHRSIRASAPHIRLPAHGELFDRRCQDWAGKMQTWVDEAMAFGQTLPQNAESAATAHNGGLKPLKAEAEKLPSAWYGKVSPPQGQDVETAPTTRRHLYALAKWADEKIKQSSEEAADAQLGTTGAAMFVVRLKKIHHKSSKVQIPLPAMLYWLAEKRVIDHFRKRRTMEIPLEAEDSLENAEPAPIDTVVDPGSEDDIKRLEFDQAVQTQLFAELERAKQTGESAQEIAKVKQRCDMREKVFILWIKGDYTQDEIAAETGLTRDQVRTHQKKITALLMPLKENW